MIVRLLRRMRDEQRPEGSWQVATRSALERMGVGEAGTAHRGKHEVSRGASLKLSRSRRWHSREVTSWLRTHTGYDVPFGGRTETLSGMGLGTCGYAISNAAADRQPAQSQQWTADYSHRSPASYRRVESRHANMHRIATCDGPSELNFNEI